MYPTDVKGNLFFKNIRTLAKGVYASYNNDRIVFYENDYSGKDFVAYFIRSSLYIAPPSGMVVEPNTQHPFPYSLRGLADQFGRCCCQHEDFFWNYLVVDLNCKH